MPISILPSFDRFTHVPAVLNSNPHADMTIRACGNIGLVAQSHRQQSGAASVATGRRMISSSAMQPYCPPAPFLVTPFCDHVPNRHGGSARITVAPPSGRRSENSRPTCPKLTLAGGGGFTGHQKCTPRSRMRCSVTSPALISSRAFDMVIIVWGRNLSPLTESARNCS